MGATQELARYRALPRAHRRILLGAALRLPLAWLRLRTTGLRRMQAWAERPPAREDFRLDEAAGIGRLVNIAARHAPWRATCLTRSLLLVRMLRERGAAAQLRIGVRLVGGALDAHAWVELDGVPVNDAPDVAEQFAPFGEMPSAEQFRAP
ncbi:MAG: lasso peptide biosynthesis B2 protein [Betaproteobacteria bacterium]|nr:lasso peptide biosynthesis B2 protein [Betaproteobacteria bacterium]MDH5223013.1 lasso peptide biosynthesis B2 protein [Betaproteobacteria bacterium]MDH5352768.1 lasso peptide biosynthesis B2 protein [Betaproteobacteria bacterium]